MHDHETRLRWRALPLLLVFASLTACAESNDPSTDTPGPDAKTADAGNTGGTGWKYVGAPGFSSGIASHTSLTFHDDGMPYVAFSDATVANKLTVMRLQNGSWSAVGAPGFTEAPVMDVATTSCAGSLYVGYRLLKVPSPYDAGFVVRLDGGTWVPVGGQLGGTGARAYRLTLACTPTGPVAAWSAYENGALSVARLDGDVWTLMGGDHGLAANAGVGLAIDAQGKPHVGFASANDDNRAAVRRFDESSTTPLGPALLTTQATSWATLAFAGPKPVFAFLDMQGLQLHAYVEDAWKPLATGVLPAEGVSANTPLLVSSSSGETFLFARTSTPDGANRGAVLKLVGEALVPIHQAVFSPHSVAFPSLAVSEGQPFVAFQDWAHDKRLSVMTPE